MSDVVTAPLDERQRQQALDVTGSYIVQAPAGSGKTELLIQRILALLATVRQPEEILAITFTRKAAAEMHRRLLESLDAAQTLPKPEQAHAAQTWALAQAVLDRDRERDWQLLASPARLQVMTIDGLCAMLARRMPWLARFGEAPTIAEEPAELYRRAAESLLARLERGGPEAGAIERLLAHLDNQLPLLRDLLTLMLARRDQWLRHLDRTDPMRARPALEHALVLQILTALHQLRVALDETLLAELCTLGAWAAANLETADAAHPLAALSDVAGVPAVSVEALPAWLALAHLLLTGDGELRKTVSKTLGFPAGSASPASEMKARMLAALERLRAHPAAVQRVRELRHLPATAYSDSQWHVLAALIELLPMADRELREIFRATGEVDFAEIARGALAALGDELAPTDLLLHLDSRLRHILVDEFQDTSRGQFELLARLTAGWQPDDGRTLFVVGDPMQSIYRFREAEVGLYLRVRARGLETVRLEPLTLAANFRSQAGLVEWFNATFARLFPAVEDDMRGAVPFAAAAPVRAAVSGSAVTLTCFVGRDDSAEAAAVVELIRRSRDADPQGRVAILVRSRSHLAAMIPALRTAGLVWHAQEIDLLNTRPVIRDLLALTRALLHPGDRVAWLSLLRAPWCGLSIDDLLRLCGDQADAAIWACLSGQTGQPALFSLLSADGQARLARVVPVLERVLAGKGRVPLRRLVETAWLALNGPAGLTAGDLDDANQLFALIEELDDGGDLVRLEALEERLARLYASPDPSAGPGLQLMTIHKAKGLEFDTVILPGLGRGVRGPERSLLLWQEQLEPDRSGEGLLLAPLPASAADDRDPTYRAIATIHAEKERLETLRLLYVAATRARQRLHLLGHVGKAGEGELQPAAGSLLRVAWPVLRGVEGEVIEASAARTVRPGAGVPLRRLPLGWSPPPPAPALTVAAPGIRRASAAAHLPGALRSFSLLSEEGRHIGTVVHAWLERIAREGVAAWPEQRLQEQTPALQASLSAAGVPQSRLDACAGRVLGALGATLRSRRGRWVLGAHREAECEWALSGIVDGVMITASIDRSFVDADGLRWVIDYKISEAGEGETPESFVEREKARYAPQIKNYLTLVTAAEPHRSACGALYFPLMDAWCLIEPS